MKVVNEGLTSPILRVDDNFAQLIDVEDDGTFVYEFRYFSSTIESIRNLANIVKISVRKTLPALPTDVFKKARESGDVRETIKDILTQEAREKDTKRSNSVDVVASGRSDITARLSNDATKDAQLSSAISVNKSSITIPGVTSNADSTTRKQSDIKEQPSAEDILGTQKVIALKPASSLRSERISAAVMQTMLDDHATVPTAGQAQAAAVDLLQNGVDPSIAGNRFNCINSTFKAAAGVGHIARVPGNKSNSTDSPAIANKQEMLVKSLYQTSQKDFENTEGFKKDAVVPVVTDVPRKEILNFKRILVDSSIVGYDDFYVVFELKTVDENTIETVTRVVKHNQFVRTFNTPRIPPRVNISPSQFPGKNVVEIEQVDPRAIRIQIMRRSIKRSEIQTISNADAKYDLVAEIPLKKLDGLFKFIDIVNNSSVVLYRCISIGEGGLIGSEFTNAVAQAVKSTTVIRHTRHNSAALHGRIVNGGIEIIVSNAPISTISIAVLRRDITLFEQEFSFLNVAQPVVSTATNHNNAIFLDKDVKSDHIYEYGCRLYFENGSQIVSTGNLIQRYIPLAVGIVNIEISNFELIRNPQFTDVRFSIKSIVTNENIDDVHQALKKQGLDSLFADALKLERDKLQSIIAHSIIRTDLTTGVNEDFGTFVGTNFVDSVIGQKNAVSKLKDGHKYRYSVGTLLRKAETVFDELKRTNTDSSTGKGYSFKPSVFRHPITLTKGTIVTRESLIRNHAEDDFAFGKIGNIREIDVTIDVPSTKLVDVTATRVDRRTASVKWNVEGNLNNIEHFIIMKETLGQARIVGKAHNISPGSTFEFLDHVEPDDIGDVSYRVVPVMGNYSRGQSVVSNSMRVIDIRSVTHG